MYIGLLLLSGIIGSVGIYGLGRQWNPRHLALMVQGLGVGLFYLLTQKMVFADGSIQLLESYTWMPSQGVSFLLGIDGLSWLLIGLTLAINLIVILSSYWLHYQDMGFYLGLFLLMQSMIIGVFSAADGLSFYVFWEGMLIPMYLCIGIWGSSKRHHAAMKFFLYTFVGSLLMLAGLIYMGIKAGSFAFSDLSQLTLSLTEQQWLFLSLFFAFAVKIPMFPFHTWLPDAHTEAPQAGSVILAALMLKVGGYGFMRLSLPLLPDASAYFSSVLIVLSLIAILYVGVIAFTRQDIKQLIAYSSVAHMGFVTLGIFLVYHAKDMESAQFGYMGGVVQMVAHAFGSGALFLAFGWLYEQYPKRLMADYRGLSTQLPWFSMFFFLFLLSSMGMPLTSGFVGEWMIIMAAIQASPWLGLLVVLSVVISAIYLLTLFRRVFFGKPNENIMRLKDLNAYEISVMFIIGFSILILGVYPQMMIDVTHASMKTLTHSALLSKIGSTL